MPSDLVPSPAVRKRALVWVRVALAAAGLTGALWLSPQAVPWMVAVTGAFLAASLLVPLRRRRDGGAFALFILFADVVYFLVLVGAGIGPDIWLQAFYFLYIMAEAVFFYRPPEVLIAVCVSAIFCLSVPTQSIHIRPTVMVTSILAYAVSIYKKRAEAQVAELAREAAETRQDAQRAREAERQRIASDFHDGPLQSFISLQMRLEILRKLLERDFGGGMDDLTDLQTLAQQQVRELRAFVRSMRPPEIQGSNLYASARRICESFQKESGIPVTFVGGEGPLKLPEDAASEVVQMLREALHNVLKHAGATRVAVSVERVAKTLELSVDDNGRGFHFSGVYSLDELELLRLGPASFKRRARALNAEMTLESRPGRGAGLKLRVPVP